MGNPTTPESEKHHPVRWEGQEGCGSAWKGIITPTNLSSNWHENEYAWPQTAGRIHYPQTFYMPVQPRLQVSAVQIHPPGNRGLFLLRTEHLTPGDQTLEDAASQSRDFHSQDTLGRAVLGNLAWQAYKFYWWLFRPQPLYFHHWLPRLCCLRTKGNSLMQEFPRPELPVFNQTEWIMSQALVDEASNGAAHSWSFEAEKSALCGLWCSDNREF